MGGPPDPHQDSSLSAKGSPDSLSSSSHVKLCHSKYDRSSSFEFYLNFDEEAFEKNIKDATSCLKDDFSHSINNNEASFKSSSFDLDSVLTETRASFFDPSHIQR